MTTNTGDNFDPNYPEGIDFQEIGVEEPPKKGKMWIDESGLHFEIIDPDEDDEESLSECCGASEIGETGLCSDCKEPGF